MDSIKICSESYRVFLCQNIQMNLNSWLSSQNKYEITGSAKYF
ncbi:hypothetical protein LGAA44_450042 [Leuconostoc gasicomitatum]|nr:hypothetical protein LGAA44_450042 [Leuconostoc gasicomitatum]